jgi:hypothetical protein
MSRRFFFALAFVSMGALAGQDNLQMVGEARLKFMFWPVYDSRLYSADGQFREGQRPLRLELEYLREIAAPELVAQTRVEWERLQPLSADEELWLQSLSRIWPNVSENDVLALELDAEGGSTFLFNGQRLGGIDNPAFGQRFLAIWLSPDTSRPQLRRALIGVN